MAIRLEPGELTVRLHYGKDLKDADWFKEQDPYVILRCGNVRYRFNTISGGGRNPVWDQEFVLRVDQETKFTLEVRDEDLIRDDWIGKAEVDIVSVRLSRGRRQELQVPLFRHLSNRQQGHLFMTLTFRPISSSGAAAVGRPACSFSSQASSQASLTSLHEQEAAAARAAAAAGAVDNAATLPGGMAGTHAHAPAAGSSLPAGLVSPGGLPDTVPSYEPTCGLIEPQPHQLLPCHRGRVYGSNTATAQTAGPTPAAPPEAAAAAATPAGAPPPYQLYTTVHAQSLHIGESFGLTAAAATAPAAPAPFTAAQIHAVNPHACAQPYSHPSVQQSYSYGPYGGYGQPPPGYGAPSFGAPSLPHSYTAPSPGVPYGAAAPPYHAQQPSYAPPPHGYGMPPPPYQAGYYTTPGYG